MCVFLLSASLQQSLAMSSRLHPSPAEQLFHGHVLLWPAFPRAFHEASVASHNQNPILPPVASHNQNLFSPHSLAHCSALFVWFFLFPSKPQLTSSSIQGCQDSTPGRIFSIFVSVTSPEDCKGQNSSVGSPQGIPQKAILHPNVSCLSPPLPHGAAQRRARKSWSVMISRAV